MSDPHKTEHAYDGIEEYDNPLPGWWKWTFVATIIVCPFYWMFYHGGADGRSIQDDYNVALAENTRLQFAEIGDLEPTEETILKFAQKSNWVRVGEIVFKTNCSSCHGREGEGKIGPNLTDEYFKHISKVDDIARVIANGAAANAMPAWSNRLHTNEIVMVSAYVANLRGTNVEGGKAAEGKLIAAWPAPAQEIDPGASSKEPGEDGA